MRKINKSFAVDIGVYDKMTDGDRWLFDLMDKKQHSAKMLLFYKFQRIMHGIFQRYKEVPIEWPNSEAPSTDTEASIA